MIYGRSFFGSGLTKHHDKPSPIIEQINDKLEACFRKGFRLPSNVAYQNLSIMPGRPDGNRYCINVADQKSLACRAVTQLY